MSKLGKNEIVKRIAIAKSHIVHMEVLREHLDADVSDAEKLATIRKFCEGTMCANVMNYDSFRNYYTWNYDGKVIE
jgi:hypothetical protein